MPEALTKSTASVRFAELAAPPGWQAIDFISDLHLRAADPATFRVWQAYLTATPADAVFILGDLFEVWVGDDAAAVNASFDQQCAEVLAAAGARLALHLMHGNRDFLIGQSLASKCHASLLADPTVLTFAERRWLLSHGDALCLDDTDYQQFRKLVRSQAWQQAFLAQPLADRQAVAKDMRSQSEDRKRLGTGTGYGDIDPQAARAWLQKAHSSSLIHGHTHRPADHSLGDGLGRTVLSDWDAQASPPRAEVLRLGVAGLQRIDLLAT